jgi:ribosomal protein S18 acetylase RimI-like enzyme
MKEIEIRRVAFDEIDQLQKISRQTFHETFSKVNTEENMAKYMTEKLSAETLSIELKNKNSEFYFAISGGKIIGYLKLTSGQSQTELNDIKSLEIERIYVLKEFHGKGVGQLLYQKAIKRSQETGLDSVWLGVWEENPRAISFYKKNGFVEFDKHIFRLGDDEQTDIMMKLQLKDIQ